MHQDSRGYWYQTKREGGRVTREYMGRGAWCGSFAQLEALDQERAQEAKAAERAALNEATALDEAVNAYCDMTADIMRATLEAAGYRQHARGQWRQQRQKQGDQPMSQTATETTTSQLPADFKKQLLASRKSATAATEFAQRLKSEGRLEGFVEGMGNMENVARDKMHKAFLGDDCLAIELTERKLSKIRQDLAGPNPTELEKLLAGRIALTFYRLNFYEAAFAVNQDGMSFKNVELWEKRITAASKRYLSAIKALATVRKLQAPNVQVNIADKQVNVGQINGAAG